MIRHTAFLGVLLGFGLPTTASGEIINVPGDQPTIQTAIDAAADGDEIVVAPGTYFENINLLGKAITLRSSAGREVTTIDANGSGSVVTCDSNEGPDTVIDGFTITGGSATMGGGMKMDGSSPTVTNCTFSTNTAGESGGAMVVHLFSNPMVTDCTFSNNTAEFGGGIAVVVGSRPILTNCIFSDNTALSGGGLGVVSAFGAVVIHCTFNGNTADSGGGIRVATGPTIVTHCAFSGNSAERGGGMCNTDTSPSVTNCTFRGNTAERGGGMCNIFGSSPTITNCAFSGNSASHSGGGMSNLDGGSPTVSNCTFSGNDADNGKAMAFDSIFLPHPGSLAMTNCILWDEGDEVWNNDNSVIDIAYSNVQGGWPGVGNIDADPLFVDADGPDNIPGTSDDNLRLSPGSPTIDAADNAGVPADTQDLDGDGDTDEPVPVDLDGNPRFVNDPDTPDTGNPDGINPIVDMGAYEFEPPDPCADEDGDGRVTICHIPPGNPDAAHTITVSVNALPAHLAHGDHCGACEEDHGPLMAGSSEVNAEPCPTDLDDSGDIGAGDLAQLLGSWGLCAGCPTDFNGDDVVGPLDLANLLAVWGPCAH